jgi:hypothetical protein
LVDLQMSVASPALAGVELPPAVRIPHPFPARNQVIDGAIEVQCCAAAATVVSMEAMEAIHRPPAFLSMMFNYYCARGFYSPDAPLPLNAALSAAVNGVCTQEFHPAAATKQGAAMRPTPEAIQNSRRHRIAFNAALSIGEYYAIPRGARIRGTKLALAHGCPVVAGLMLFESYLNLQNDPVFAAPSGESLGGHAVALLGYDDAEGCFIVKDSRGPEFADEGCWKLPYGLIEASWAVELFRIHAIYYE